MGWPRPNEFVSSLETLARGALMSTASLHPRQVVLALSIISFWSKAVAALSAWSGVLLTS